jgi:GDP-4-dehydro-6-deoxy-D-mannose reductase
LLASCNLLSMLKILVTGVNGFVGKHLARELKSRGYEVMGLGHEASAHPDVMKAVDKYEVCDLTVDEQVNSLDLAGVNAVINLAGLANAGASFDAEKLYKKVNVEVLEKLGNHMLNSDSKARLIAISSGALYDPNQPLPLTETSKTVSQSSPYAMSKLMMEDVAKDLKGQGLDCVTIRPFNHFGPGQMPGFLIPDLYQKLGQAREGGTITVGNLATKRDYTDVRDVVKAYADLAASETLGFDLYNVCSGTSRSGQEVLDTMLTVMGLADKVSVEVDQSLIRPSDPAELYGSYERLNEETGWEPTIPFEQTIQDIVAA